MVTAELAMGLPALMAVLVLAAAGLGLGSDAVRCTEAARVGARVAARGEGVVAARDAAARTAPTGALVTVDSAGRDVRVRVVAASGLWARLGLPGRAGAEAVVPAEDTSAGSAAWAR